MSTKANARVDTLDSVFTLINFVKAFPQLFDGDSSEVNYQRLRWQLAQRNVNGLSASGAVIGSYKKPLIDAERYRDWLANSEHYRKQAMKELDS